MKKALQDPRFNATEIAARAFPTLTRDYALKALHRELRKTAPAPEFAGPLRHELGQLHHMLNGAAQLMHGPTAYAAVRQVLRDPRITLRHFALRLFPDEVRNTAVSRARLALAGTNGARLEPAQMKVLAADFAELQAKLAAAIDLGAVPPTRE